MTPNGVRPVQQHCISLMNMETKIVGDLRKSVMRLFSQAYLERLLRCGSGYTGSTLSLAGSRIMMTSPESGSGNE